MRCAPFLPENALRLLVVQHDFDAVKGQMILGQHVMKGENIPSIVIRTRRSIVGCGLTLGASPVESLCTLTQNLVVKLEVLTCIGALVPLGGRLTK